MSPDREYIAKNGDKVQEYYWAGKMVVYVNNQLSKKTFNELVDEYETLTLAGLNEGKEE